MSTDNTAPDTALVWFRDDLRLADHPALNAAQASGKKVLCIYIWDPDDARAPGGAMRWWLHQALAALDHALRQRGSQLLLLAGPVQSTLVQVVAASGAGSVYWNRRYGIAERSVDAELKLSLRALGCEVVSRPGGVLYEPWTIRTGSDGSYQVFSAYWRACARAGQPALPESIAADLRWAALPALSDGDPLPVRQLDDLQLQPSQPDWADGLRSHWMGSEQAGWTVLDQFLDEGIVGYSQRRDFPGMHAASRLSPYLRLGLLSVRQVWYAVLDAANERRLPSHDVDKFLQELGWRDFSYYLRFYHPALESKPLQAPFAAMPWRTDRRALRQWQRGLTGYPLVDAGMRQLWASGWMHNRVRMVVASFLVKHLLLDWRLGEAWFWDTLVDADAASNPASWQWVAGCGMDAAPYFRIFNPVLQSQKFDPDGDYIRRWIPELAGLPSKLLHQPWTASASQLQQAGVRLGIDYPEPCVEHGMARERALQALAQMRASAHADDVLPR